MAMTQAQKDAWLANPANTKATGPEFGTGKYSAGKIRYQDAPQSQTFSPVGDTSYGRGTGNPMITGRDQMGNGTTPYAPSSPSVVTPPASTGNYDGSTNPDGTPRYSSPTAGVTPFDENAIRAQYASDLQAQLDAIRAGHAGQIARETQAGANRVGMQRGLSTISGTRYSPRGAAEAQGVVDVNQQAQDAINQQILAEQAAARAASMGLETNDLAQRRQEAATAAQNAAANYFSQQSLNQTAAENAANNAYRYGIATGNLNGIQTLDMARYLADQQQQQVTNAQSAAELKLRQDEAQKKGYQIQQFADGTVVSFDPTTGQQTVLGKYAAPRTGGSAGTKATISPDSTAYDQLISDLNNGLASPTDLSAQDWANINARQAYLNQLNAGGGAGGRVGFDTGAQFGPPVPQSETGQSRYGGPNVPIFGTISNYGNRALDWLYGK